MHFANFFFFNFYKNILSSNNSYDSLGIYIPNNTISIINTKDT